AGALFVVLVANRRLALDGERVGAHVADDRGRHHGVHPLNERHHRDDRRDGHDVAEHRHERTKFVRPNGAKRAVDRFEDLVHDAGGGVTTGLYGVARRDGRELLFCCSRTPSPSASSRTEANGPVITWSPDFSPSVTSKYCSPAIPVLSGVKIALPS